MPVGIFILPGIIAFIFAFYKGFKQYYRRDETSTEEEW
ncbi:TRAP-type mannitol/chloroaromatic compound transport system permease small subunit [Pedobacter sp. UYP30]